MSDTGRLEDNKRLARQYLLALGEMRLDDARQLMHEKCRCELPTVSLEPNVFDRDGMLTFILSIRKIIPGGICFVFKEMTAEENRVSVIVDGHSTTIEGKDYDNRYHFLLNLEEGKIIRHLEYFDSFLGAKVMGPLLRRQMSSS